MHAPPGNLPPGFRGEGTPACCRLTAPESVDPSRSCDMMSEVVTLARTGAHCVSSFPVFIDKVFVERTSLNELGLLNHQLPIWVLQLPRRYPSL